MKYSAEDIPNKTSVKYFVFFTLGFIALLYALLITLLGEPSGKELYANGYIQSCSRNSGAGRPASVTCSVQMKDGSTVNVLWYGQVPIGYQGRVTVQKNIGEYTGANTYVLLGSAE